MSPEERKTVVYMFRHGEPTAEFRDRLYGQMDVPLSDRGRRQSISAAERLAAIRFDAVYSSDLQRAGFLAECMAKPLDLPVRRLEVFRERHLGEFQGMTQDEVRQSDPERYEQWQADRVHFKSDGGENFPDLQERIMPAVETLVQSFEGGRILIATHAGPIRVALAHVLGMPITQVLNFVLDYACVSVIEYPVGGNPRVKLVNG